MGKKYEPTEEELERIFLIYNRTKSYAAVSRELDLSTQIVSRIITENPDKIINFELKELFYGGPTPTESALNYLSPNKKIFEKFYEDMVRTNGVL